MRLYKYAPLLAVVLPPALGQYHAPSNNTCSFNASRCDNNALQVCSDNGTWQTVKDCSNTAYCFAQETRNGTVKGDCYPLISGNDAQCSTVNDHRCDMNNGLQKCGDPGYWNTVKNCTETAFCFAQKTANGGGDCYPLISGDDKQCSTVDTHRCGTNNNLEICGSHGYWSTAKNCTNTAYCFVQQTTSGGGGNCYPFVNDLDEQCSIANEVRCENNKLKRCTLHGYWKVVKDCKHSEMCWLNTKNMDGGFCIPSSPKDDPLRCKANTHRCYENTIQDCTMREHWSDSETCTADQVCINNCKKSGCKPYCLGRDQLYNLAAVQKNVSSTDATPENARPKLESCDRPGIERCMYDAPIRIQSCINGNWIDKEICATNTICWADNDGEETAECAGMPELLPNSARVRYM